MPFELQFGTLLLDGFHELSEETGTRIFSHTFPRKNGSIVAQVPAFDSTRLVLEGDIFSDTEEDLRDAVQELRTALATGMGKIRKYGVTTPNPRVDDNAYLNVVRAKLVHAHSAQTAPATHATIKAEFLASDPHWYQDAETTLTNPLTGTSTTFQTPNQGGTNAPFIMTLTRTAGTDITPLVLTNTTTTMILQFNALLSVGQTLVFDTLNGRVLLGGANAIHLFGPGQIYQELAPGTNNWSYQGPSTVSVQTKFRARWA